MVTDLAVVFDLGGVLVEWDVTPAVAGLMDAAAWERAAAELDFPGLNALSDAGRPYAETIARVERRHADRPDLVAAYRHYVEHVGLSFPGPVPGTTAVVEDLLAAGVRVLGLTNWSAETVHHSWRAAPVVARFEGLVVSGAEGVTKPDPRLYRILLDRYALDPARTVYVDDRADNVDAARALGMLGEVFTDAAALRADLAALGLPVAPGGEHRA